MCAFTHWTQQLWSESDGSSSFVLCYTSAQVSCFTQIPGSDSGVVRSKAALMDESRAPSELSGVLSAR